MSNGCVGSDREARVETRETVGPRRNRRGVDVEPLAAGVALVQVDADRDDDGDGLLEGHPPALGPARIEQDRGGWGSIARGSRSASPSRFASP